MRIHSFQRTRAARSGFTLVEVMVAAALSVVIMTIIATAFQTGLETLSHLKSVAGLADRLRAAESVLRNDLAAPHLYYAGSDPGIPSGVVPVSHAKVVLWRLTTDPGMQGFFRVVTPTSITEATTDGYGMESSRATDHWLHFTVRLLGNDPAAAFAARAPDAVWRSPVNMAGLAGAGQLASRWAEVAYFLVPQSGATTLPDTGPGLPLHTLRRRQRVIANDDIPSVPPFNVDEYPELSATTNLVNTPRTITEPVNRLGNGGVPAPIVPYPLPSGDYRGSDIVLDNVISMRIKALCDNQPEYENLPGTEWDSATNPISGGHRLRAIRLQLRIYDPKNRMTRQVTIDQAL